MMMYTERAETAAVSCGISHVSSVRTPLRWILKQKQNTHSKNLVTHVEPHASAVSLLESGDYRYIKAINNNNEDINQKQNERTTNEPVWPSGKAVGW